MTNPILVNFVKNTLSILWQYDKAPNLIKLIGGWNSLSDVSVRKFWDTYCDHIFAINPVYTGRETEEEKEELEKIDSFALDVWGNLMGISRPIVSYDSTQHKISDDLYRRLLLGRFFLMNRRPTVENYNRYLGIVFPDKTKKCESVDGEKERYYPRNKALDFGTKEVKDFMSMSFTFPTETGDEAKDKEEAYLIFQHYDLVYRFPAGIRTNCSFCDTSRVIGFDGQGLRNFSDGFVWADDDTKNGGILSSTEKANYKKTPTVKGAVYIVNVEDVTQEYKVTMENDSSVWIDWGDGDNNERNGNTEYAHKFIEKGLFAVAVYYNNDNKMTNELSDKKYVLA